jgi:hypothetical protein
MRTPHPVAAFVAFGAMFVVVAACGDSSGDRDTADKTPGSDVVLVPGEGELAQGSLVDESGLITEWEFAFELSDAESAQAIESSIVEVADEVWLTAGPAGWDLSLVWSGLPCNVRPTVEVAGSDEELSSLTVKVGPKVVPDTNPPTECEAVEARHALYLKTAATAAPDIRALRRS